MNSFVKWRQMALFACQGRYCQISYVWLENYFLWRPEKLYPHRYHTLCIPHTNSIPHTLCIPHTKCASLIHYHQPFLLHYSQSSSDITQKEIPAAHVKRIGKEIERGSPEHLKKISSILNCTVEEVKLLSLKYKFLLNISLDLMQEKVQLVLSYGLPYSFIRNNMRILHYVSTLQLKRRLKMLEEHSLMGVKSLGFKLQCQVKIFTQLFEIYYRNKQTLEGCTNKSEYIQHRLQCTEEEAQRLLSTSTFAKGYSSVKLKNQLDFLLTEANVSPEFVLRNAKLLAYSIDRLRHRLQVMERDGITDPAKMRLFWYCSAKTFNRLFPEKPLTE